MYIHGQYICRPPASLHVRSSVVSISALLVVSIHGQYAALLDTYECA